MGAKKTRLETLRTLLQENTYESQEDILHALNDAGFAVAQPTLSRDLRALKVSKVFTEKGHYAYVLPAINTDDANRMIAPHSLGFLSVDFSGNMAVIKTASGFASSLAAELDSLKAKEVLGTVSGDNTFIIVLREGTSHSVVHNMLKAVVPDYEE
ncbi:MAG: arginine repressor [Prevotellaceae bacterium]|nr:arginine repressor [Prevotellaceae bacterium]